MACHSLCMWEPPAHLDNTSSCRHICFHSTRPHHSMLVDCRMEKSFNSIILNTISDRWIRGTGSFSTLYLSFHLGAQITNGASIDGSTVIITVHCARGITGSATKISPHAGNCVGKTLLYVRTRH